MRAVSFCRKCPLSEGMRGQKQNLPDIALSGSFSEGAVSLLTEGVTHLPFTTIFAFDLSRYFLRRKITLSDFSFCSPQGRFFLYSKKETKVPVRRKEDGAQSIREKTV